ncbi:MAG: hypothetical protein RJQ09_05575 [Cyclobacteriaceae bacterium]
MAEKKVEFRQIRDFGQVIGSTFEFLKGQYKPLIAAIFKNTLLLLCLTMVALGALIYLIYTISSFPGTSEEYIIPAFAIGTVAFVVLMVFGVQYNSTVFEFIKAYVEGEEEIGNKVSEAVKSNFWRNLGTHVGLVLVAIVVFLIPYFIMLGLIFAASNSPVAIFLTAIIFIGIIFYLMVPISLYLPVRYFEDVDIATAAKRCFYLIREKWWLTFGVIFVIQIIQSGITYIFILPIYVVFIASTFLNFDNPENLEAASESMVIFMVVIYSLMLIIMLFTYVLIQTGVAMQYFNLKEHKESTGLLGRIENMGSTTQEEDEETY